MLKQSMTFNAWFQRATGHPPFPWQRALATGDALPDLLEAPTGAGKTAGATLAWLWRRRHAPPEVRVATPRRLVWCLPMRSLVTQTAQVVRGWLDALGLAEELTVHVLLGGAVENDWDEAPEQDRVLVGTQDLLLSRALMRGYAMSRYRWPVAFAQLHDDALWVLDEVQLMGVGLSTSAQLQAFRERWGSYGPARSLWMSATLDPGALATVDLRRRDLVRMGLSEDDRAQPSLARRLNAPKPLTRAQTDMDAKRPERALAAEVLAAHQEGSLTLVVLNRVQRAQALFAALRGQGPEVRLLHARFRPAERAAVEAEVLSAGWSGVLVATQVVEAGVDLSARALFTELAPWPSLVQRFGRCNRRGEYSAEQVTVRWIDLPDKGDAHLPYPPEALQAARARLQGLEEVSIRTLEGFRDPPAPPARPVLRARDLRQLFDTSPDLAGHDIDVSPYIRDSEDRDLRLAWRTWEGRTPPPDAPALHRDELCAAPIAQLAKLLQRSDERAFRWDPLLRRWAEVRGERLVPGWTLLLPTAAGGYDGELGWTGASANQPPALQGAGQPQDADALDPWTFGCARFVTLRDHALDAVAAVDALSAPLGGALPWDALREAARWHDLGKVHACFQALLIAGLPEHDPRRFGGPWAKSDGRSGGPPARSGFRHELASALAWLAQGGDDLGAYLIAAHHGKVRMSLRALPGEPPPPEPGRRYARGVWEDDRLPEAELGDGVVSQALRLSLECMEMGEGEAGPSWSARVHGLLDALGPFRLATLEALLRVADWRATRARLEVEDA